MSYFTQNLCSQTPAPLFPVEKNEHGDVRCVDRLEAKENSQSHVVSRYRQVPLCSLSRDTCGLVIFIVSPCTQDVWTVNVDISSAVVSSKELFHRNFKTLLILLLLIFFLLKNFECVS